MSFDLYFRSKAGSLSRDGFSAYFKDKPNYTLEDTNVSYMNERTDVYFFLDYEADTLEPGDDLPEFASEVSLNINYIRPFFFILEIEPQITAFVEHFDLDVYDPQLDNDPADAYSPDALKKSWASNNNAAIRAMVKMDPESLSRYNALPQQTLVKAWQWNYKNDQLQRQLTDSIYVAKVMVAQVEGRTVTIAVWPDGIPLATPPVDYLYAVRDRLAVRRFFSPRRADKVLIPWKQALPVLSKHGSIDAHGMLKLEYQTPPAQIVKFIQSFKPGSKEKSITNVEALVDLENLDAGKA